MKNLKKLGSIALALVMAMALMVPAFAARPAEDETPGSIDISNAIPGKDYSIYRIFDVESYGTSAQSYKINSAWTGFFASGTPATYIRAQENGYVSWIGPATNTPQLAQFAKDALAYAKNEGGDPSPRIAPITTKTAPEAVGGAETSTVSFDNLPLGWYLVDSSVGALCSLNVTTPEAAITEKNETVPTPEKTESDVNVVDGVGDVINYTVKVQVKPGAENYVLRDTMSTGLTYNNDIVAKVETSGATVALEDATLGTGETFAKRIVNVGNYVNETIVFTYSATINENAVTVDKLTNSAKVTYGNGNETLTDGTVYDLGDLTINKWALADGEGTLESRRTALPGAQFKLYHSETDTNAISLVLENGAYRPAKTGETGTDVIDMTNASSMTIKGLKGGTYWVEESHAPDGYNALVGRKSVTLTYTKDHETDTTDVTVADNSIDIDNQTGAVLPSTGGMGTTIFYAVGGVLLVGSAILFVTKKRMGE